MSEDPTHYGRTATEILKEEYPTIYNGHPGLITTHPVLKGKDPQEKAYNLGLTVSGCVIHGVTEGVDEGPVLREKLVEIQNLNLDEVYSVLHKASIDLWVDFLQ